MVTCLTDATAIAMEAGTRKQSSIIARFEELLAANPARPLYLAEICAATGVSERTLRICCHDYLGMGPIRYLWLRRMHLARDALILADSTTSRDRNCNRIWLLGAWAFLGRVPGTVWRTAFGIVAPAAEQSTNIQEPLFRLTS